MSTLQTVFAELDAEAKAVIEPALNYAGHAITEVGTLKASMAVYVKANWKGLAVAAGVALAIGLGLGLGHIL